MNSDTDSRRAEKRQRISTGGASHASTGGASMAEGGTYAAAASVNTDRMSDSQKIELLIQNVRSLQETVGRKPTNS